MAYRHGVYISESPTKLQVPVAVDSALPVAVGIAPVHRLENPAGAVNEPFLIYEFAEGVAALGYSEDWKKFGLSMMLYSQTRIHNSAPLILINVWDPLKNAQQVAAVAMNVVNGVITIEGGMAMISTVSVSDNNTEYVRGVDYDLKYDGEDLLITIIDEGNIPAGTASLDVAYKEASVAGVTDSNIGGGIDPDTNKRSGIELIDEVFPRYQKKLGFILCPGFSHIPGVAALMIAKAKKVNCVALLDLPCEGQYVDYKKIPQWKNDNGYLSPFAFADWPCVAIADQVFYASVRIAGMFGETDGANGGLPYEQVSNKTLQMTKICQPDGTLIPMMTPEQANFLNENGIGTFINWSGWRAWGVETTAFPGNTDIKDFERSVRRMFIFVENVIQLTMASRVDRPIRKLLIDSILLTANEYLNTIKSRGAIIGGYVEFLRSDNSNQSIMSGKLYFAVHLTPPNAAKEIEFNFEYDPSALDTLFG